MIALKMLEHFDIICLITLINLVNYIIFFLKMATSYITSYLTGAENESKLLFS